MRDLAGYPVTAETYMSILRFHSSMIRPRIKARNSQLISPAPLQIRDAVFRELIRSSPASNYMEELVTGLGGLLSRGLLKDHATSYGALPQTKQGRAAFARILNHYVCARFPEYAKIPLRDRYNRSAWFLAGTIWHGPHLETAQLFHAASGSAV
jgi:hypothetical protein